MTQEKLAEILGVTVGAVYKWESGLSQPELELIIKMADLFDTSVDVLLGYKMYDSRISATIERLDEYRKNLDPALLDEAERALTKYPNSFQLVNYCANIYLFFGITRQEKDLFRKAISLLERAIVLLPQNKDPNISESGIYGTMATAMFLLNEKDRAVELLKNNNAGGIFNDSIGLCLALDGKNPDDAMPFLSGALFDIISQLVNVLIAYIFVFRARKDWDSCIRITEFGISFINGIRTDAGIDFFDKTVSEILVLLAYAQLNKGIKKEAINSLKNAREKALEFDAAPDYGIKSIRFAKVSADTMVVDILGATATESISKLMEMLDEPQLKTMWEEISEDENGDER
ncbi:MAG: helix-turn-helix domain-containing protein [Clostridia bacterium]|nr:helix-turn-helix domain-containing protein [Clostridia bacterium]